MRIFNKLVIIDNIIIFQEHLEELQKVAKEIIWRITNDSENGIIVQDYINGPTCSLEVGYQKPSQDELLILLKDADAVITCWTPVSDEVLMASPQIKYIGFWTNLYEHRINSVLAKERGIHIDFIPDYGTQSVAEFVFSGLQLLGRKVNKHHENAKKGKWLYENLKVGRKIIFEPQEIENWLLFEKKIGIVGLGRVGTRVAEIAKFGFQMDVAYYSNTRKHEAEKKGIVYKPLKELFKWADFISLHLSPSAPKKMIDSELLSLLRPEQVIINTGSGHVLDQNFLIELLKKQKCMAFLDVYEGLPPRKELKDLPNALFTYRAAWFTKEAIKYKARKLIDNIYKYLNNE